LIDFSKISTIPAGFAPIAYFAGIDLAKKPQKILAHLPRSDNLDP